MNAVLGFSAAIALAIAPSAGCQQPIAPETRDDIGVPMEHGLQLARWVPPEDLEPGPVEIRFWIDQQAPEGATIVSLQNGWAMVRYEFVAIDDTDRHKPVEVTPWWSRDVDVNFTTRPLAELTDRPAGLCLAVGRVLRVSDDGSSIELRLDGPERSVLAHLELVERKNHDRPPSPTLRGVRYGPHARHLLDFFEAPGEGPRPVVLHIHGGGWGAGDKRSINLDTVTALNDAGISVAAISYRFLWMVRDQGVRPPVRAPMEDAMRALQFIRHHATALNIDPSRVGAWGGSAGGCTALWLALTDDHADHNSDDPIARRSTRLTAVAATVPQTTLDPHLMVEWIGPAIDYGASAFGERNFEAFYNARDRHSGDIALYSPVAHVTADDPPAFLDYSARPNILPSPAGNRGLAVHHPVFGAKLAEALAAVGVEHDFTHRDLPPSRWADLRSFLIDQLTAPE